MERYVLNIFIASPTFPRGGKFLGAFATFPSMLENRFVAYSEERKCYRPPRIFIFRDLRRGSTGTFPPYVFRVFAYFPAGLPRELARGAALRGHPGQVRMLQKMPKY